MCLHNNDKDIHIRQVSLSLSLSFSREMKEHKIDCAFIYKWSEVTFDQLPLPVTFTIKSVIWRGKNPADVGNDYGDNLNWHKND